MDTPIYVVNYKNDERRQRMSERLTALGFQFKFTDPVETSDSRLSDPDKNIPEGNKRVWAIMLQHLDSIRDFYENTTKSHCIVCEDDIYIKKSMPNILEAIIKKSEELNFDVVLLGYLMPYKIEMNTILHSQYYKIIDTDESIGHVYHKYPCDLWGSQMYMVSRENAKTLLDPYLLSIFYKMIYDTAGVMLQSYRNKTTGAIFYKNPSKNFTYKVNISEKKIFAFAEEAIKSVTIPKAFTILIEEALV
jgi:GR25 family glycosyltransferase involved in LPS biosynthesis